MILIFFLHFFSGFLGFGDYSFCLSFPKLFNLFTFSGCTLSIALELRTS